MDSIRLYYALTYELAGLYKNMSQKHIMPGLALLSDLNIDGSSVEKKNAKIKRYTLEAQQATNKFARNVSTRCSYGTFLHYPGSPIPSCHALTPGSVPMPCNNC